MSFSANVTVTLFTINDNSGFALRRSSTEFVCFPVFG